MPAKRTARTGKEARPTIKTLAALTGFSIATVSKALSDSPVVASTTRATIFKAARDIGYQANARGVALRTGRTFQAAVLMPVTAAANYEWDGVEHTQILYGISQALEGTQYRIAVHAVRDAEDGLKAAQRIVELGLADGMIFSGVQLADPRIDYALARAFPFVSLGRCHRPLDYAHVDVDGDWAAHAATQRLIRGDHRRIALINPRRQLAHAHDRIEGYRRALTEAGLPFAADLICSSDLTGAFGKESAERLSELADPPTGFICANEATALGALAGLSARGRRPGVDVSVISYDDINVSGYFSPPLTTLFLPVERLGRKLGEFLLRRIAGEPARTLQAVFRPTIVPRQPDRLETQG